MKRVISFVISLLLLLSVFSFCFSADGENDYIELQIEGISTKLFYGELKAVPEGQESISVADLLRFAVSEYETLTITGLDEGYITDINGDTAGKFGGWDGWLFQVNGEDAPAGITDVTVKNGDSVLFYFGDPYGVGMQFPNAEYEETEKKLTFNSADTTYDADYNPTVTVNPVTGMTVGLVAGFVDVSSFSDANPFETEGTVVETFVTDENGTVDLSEVDEGDYTVLYYKTAENGLPLVLRGYTTVTISETTVPSPDTFDANYIYIGLTIISLAACLVITYVCRKKKTY